MARARKTTDQRAQRIPRGILSRESILRAAYDIVKFQGLHALSMPGLGRALGASPMSIYRHFRDRQDLVDALTGLAMEEQYSQRPRDRGRNWQDSLRAQMRDSCEFFRAHPGLGELLLNGRRPHLAPEVLARLDSRVEMLVAAGFSAPEAARLWNSLTVYTWGFVAWAQPRGEVYTGEWRRCIADLEPGQAPFVAKAADAFAGASETAQFEFGLDMIIRGAAARLAARSSS